jgi:hypothetical protein
MVFVAIRSAWLLDLTTNAQSESIDRYAFYAAISFFRI